MKKFLILAIGILLSAGSVTAQNRGRGNGRQFSAKERVETLKKELNLSDEQTEKVTTLYNEFEKKSNAQNGDRRQMRTEMEKLNKNVEKLLNDDQKKTYKKLQEKERQRGNNRGNRGDRQHYDFQ